MVSLNFIEHIPCLRDTFFCLWIDLFKNMGDLDCEHLFIQDVSGPHKPYKECEVYMLISIYIEMKNWHPENLAWVKVIPFKFYWIKKKIWAMFQSSLRKITRLEVRLKETNGSG